MKPAHQQFLQLVRIINNVSNHLTFCIMEIGAVPLDDDPERFHALLDMFPGSKVHAFEVDHELCNKLNQSAKQGLTFYPIALGEKDEQRPFYETLHPMCSSLYRPNEELMNKYNAMKVAILKKIGSIHTINLDQFTLEHSIDDVDFIKIDIQGAELDVFKGSIKTLENVIAVVSEVEFIPHYVDQPLFGDVCTFLKEHQLMFHKFLGMSGRTIRPLVINNNPTMATQHIWTDAVFITDILKISDLEPDKLLKLAVLAYLYGSPDVTFHCMKLHDEKMHTSLQQSFINSGL